MTESNCISYPTIKLWEETGASLLIAIKSYMDLCLNLGTQSLREGILAEDLTARIDYTLGAIHLPMSRQLAASSAALAQSRNNLASPFHRLPAEVMFEIFMAVVYDATDKEIINPPYMEQDVLVIYRRLYNLLGTCSTWKDIIINRGALWSVIPMTRNPRTHKQGPFRLSLERSTGNKLHLAVNPWISTTSSDLNEVLTKYLPRFHSINLEAVNHHEATATIEKLLQSDTHESLSKLSIGVYMGYSIFDSIPRESDHIISRNHPQHALFQRLLERLTAIHISGAIIRWDTLTFSTRLNELRIERVALGYDDQIIPFLQTLSSASELRDLKIVSVVTFRRSPTTTPNMKRTSLTWFPRLRSLLIQDVYLNTLEFLLPTISHGSHHLVLFLSDKSLQIKSLEDNDNNDDETEGSEGSEDWSPKLVNLCEILEPVSVDTLMISGHGTWGGMWLTGTMFRRLLQSMPTIKTLKIDNWYLTPDLWESLRRLGFWDVPTDTQESLFPVLENIYLTKVPCFRTEGFREMVASHPLQRLVLEATEDHIKYLLTYSSRQPEEDTINLINWLKANVREFRLKNSKYDYPPEFHPGNWRLW